MCSVLSFSHIDLCLRISSFFAQEGIKTMSVRAIYSHHRTPNHLWTLGTLIILITTISASVLGMESGQLIKIGDCTCPEDIVTYNCIVNAPGLGGFTIWRGTAFDECPDVQNRVLLRHNSYQNGGAFGQCGDAIVGRSLQVEPNFVYISQLQINIAANPGLIGRTVECVYNPSGNTIIFINSTTIDIEDSSPSPTDVQLAEVTPSKLTFSWNSAPTDCSTLRYITDSNCGSCSNLISNETAVSCSFEQLSTSDNFCTFSVRSEICRNISGIKSTPISVNLRVPTPPSIHSVMPIYGANDNSLHNLSILFNDVDSFDISKGVNGSALYYEVSYSIEENVCDTRNLSSTLCNQGVCSISFDVVAACRRRIGVIKISVTAFNRLGSGPPSQLILGNNNRQRSSQPSTGQRTIAAATTIPLLVVIAAAIVVITIVGVVIIKSRMKTKKQHSAVTPDSESMKLLNGEESTNEQQSVRVHVTFTVEDKPEKLIEALQILRDFKGLNIKNIKICLCESETKKTVYIECHRDFSPDEAELIKKLTEEKLPDTVVYRVAEDKKVPKDEKYDPRFMKEISEVLQDVPGALCELLKMIQTIDVCKHIIITDIIHEPVPDRDSHKRVTVRFVPELPAHWREEYDKRRNKCRYIESAVDRKTGEQSISL